MSRIQRNYAWACDDLELFYGEVNLGRISIEMGKTVKMPIKGKILQEMGSRTEYQWFWT